VATLALQVGAKSANGEAVLTSLRIPLSFNRSFELPSIANYNCRMQRQVFRYERMPDGEQDRAMRGFAHPYHTSQPTEATRKSSQGAVGILAP
jgi:hypothetical protein